MVAVVGRDPFGDRLEATIGGQTVKGRSIRIERAARPRDLAGAPARALRRRGRRCRTPGRSWPTFPRGRVLTVGAVGGFAGAGGMVEFRVTPDARVAFDIDRRAVERAGLLMSSQLLKIARIVGQRARSVIRLSDMSIRRKLALITALASGVALMAAGLALVTYDRVSVEGTMLRRLRGVGDILAYNSATAIVFRDPDSAAKTLEALRSDPHVEAACVYTADGALFAGYGRRQAGEACPPGPGEGAERIEAARDGRQPPDRCSRTGRWARSSCTPTWSSGTSARARTS